MLTEDSKVEDLTLLGRAAEGDRRSFDLLVGRHQSAVFRLARALTASAAMAEDVLQETFVAAWRHAGGFRGDASVKTWLFTITRNKAARAQRRRAGEPAEQVPLHELGVDAGWGHERTPEQEAQASESRQALHRALDSLPELDRSVIVLRDLEGLTGPEAAAVLELPLPTLKTKLHRARLKLMAALREGGHHGP